MRIKATTRYMIAAGLVAVALLTMLAMWEPAAPAPPPPGPGEFSLRGKFQGPSASSDAVAISGLCDELAEMLAYDGAKPAGEQRIRTGASIEDLRVAAREARMRGDSIGARQPKAREAIQQFLDQAAGTDGGPLTPEKRADWVAAFRAVGRAAANASE
jgi:hypothetical protein